MCQGTKCTHHIDPAIEWVEQDYDSKLDVLVPVYEGEPEGDPDGLRFEIAAHIDRWQPDESGLEHIQPMFTLKYDHGDNEIGHYDSASWPDPGMDSISEPQSEEEA